VRLRAKAGSVLGRKSLTIHCRERTLTSCPSSGGLATATAMFSPTRPGGVKPMFLAQRGHEIINPKLPTTTLRVPSGAPKPSSTTTSRLWSLARHEAAPWP